MRTFNLLPILAVAAVLLAACQPTNPPAPATLAPAGQAPATQPAYPPPVTPNQERATPTTRPTGTRPATVSPELTQPYPAPASLDAKATPVSDSPAAGVCDLQEGDQVTFEIFPDIPSPRCAQALPQQHLHVINRTQADLEVSLASFQATLAPEQDIVLGVPLGDYLLPGVHVVVTSAYGGGGGPELWLLEAAPSGTPGSSTPGYPAP